MATTAPIVRADGEGPRRWFLGGGTHTWKVTAEEADGAFFMFEDSLTGGKMTPLHCHPHSDEAIFVLEGEIVSNINGTEHRVQAGGVTFVPRGVPHAFRVSSPTARLLAMQAPGTAGSFYWDASEPADSDGSGPVDFERLQQVARSDSGTEMLGPPPFPAS